jgi:2-isopropylmalate synthase
LLLKHDYAERFDTGISHEKLKTISRASHLLDEILNRSPNRHAPYVGESAFAHKGGLHVSAVQKDPRTYEHVPPETVGNRRRILISDQAGRSNIIARLHEAGIAFRDDDPKLVRLLDEVKEREFLGYSYDGAEASFELLARRMLGSVPEFFAVDSFRVSVEQKHDSTGALRTVSEATVKLKIGHKTMINTAEGHGPIDSLDAALRKDLGALDKYLADLQLVDFKVRILTTGTGAVTRVLVESKDGAGARWFTVGVSENIIEASFEALRDSIIYKLLRDKAPVPK